MTLIVMMHRRDVLSKNRKYKTKVDRKIYKGYVGLESHFDTIFAEHFMLTAKITQ